MESCLEDMNRWLDPLYELMEACARDNQNCQKWPKECRNQQTDFEFYNCEWNLVVGTKCSFYETCYTGAIKKADADCDVIQLRAAARQADNETAERIKCLLGVLMIDDNATKVAAEGSESKADKLKACKSVSYAQFNAAWKITCPAADWPPKAQYPAGLNCSAPRHDPCSNDFFQAEYHGRVEFDLKKYDPNCAVDKLNEHVGICKACITR